MPDNCFEACEWLLPKITVALSDCKILPIRLQHLKHQDVLRDSNACYGAPCLCICLEVYTHVWVQALRHEDRPWQTMLLSWKPLTTRSSMAPSRTLHYMLDVQATDISPLMCTSFKYDSDWLLP